MKVKALIAPPAAAARLASSKTQMRDLKDIEIIDHDADRLNREAMDVLGYQQCQEEGRAVPRRSVGYLNAVDLGDLDLKSKVGGQRSMIQRRKSQEKITILFQADLYQHLTALARDRHSSLGDLVRAACRAQYGPANRQERSSAVAELASMSLPVSSVGQMKRESVPW
jgi:hypothetical protein